MKPDICHVEWGTTRPKDLEKFLQEMFGWQFKPLAPNYLLYQPAGGGVSVGILDSDKMSAGGTPNVSVRVDDMDVALAKAEELGGKVAVKKTSMGAGFFAFVASPDGNLIGLQQT